MGEEQRERETQNLKQVKQAPGFELSARTHEPTNHEIMT